MAELFFEDSAVEAYISIGDDRSPLVVTFSEMGMQAGSGAWGGGMLEKLGYSYVGFVSKRPNWFPRASIERAYALVAPDFRKNRTVVTYGHSQGGFAALKYCELFKAQVALAFSPQFSICPTSMAGADRRFSGYYVGDWHAGHDIVARDIASDAHVFLFFDPVDQYDGLNARHIKSVVPQAHEVKVFGTGHSSIRPFANSQAFQTLISLATKGDLLGIKRLERDVKHRWPQRLSYLARATAFTRPALCKKLLAGVHDLAPETCSEILNGLLACGEIEFVSRYANGLLSNSTGKTRLVILEALIAAGNVADAVNRCVRWLIDNPTDTQIADFLHKQVSLLSARETTAGPVHGVGGLCRLGMGWYPAEAWGAWSLSLHARVFIDMSKVPADASEIRIPIRYLSAERQTVSVRCWQGAREFAARIEDACAVLRVQNAQGSLVVDLQVDRLLSPAACGLAADSRLLGLGVRRDADWTFA
ncbi:hypothetical protein [Paraburkholderia sp. J67]|uniref:hypothetical protein n=1 Tax=Paraburkholderia sp. J67 TaxID=2805435 RepID=UPI002ABE3229|nr:hypothetical protein [Paraburkholderia sp. J67]